MALTIDTWQLILFISLVLIVWVTLTFLLIREHRMRRVTSLFDDEINERSISRERQLQSALKQSEEMERRAMAQLRKRSLAQMPKFIDPMLDPLDPLNDLANV